MHGKATHIFSSRVTEEYHYMTNEKEASVNLQHSSLPPPAEGGGGPACVQHMKEIEGEQKQYLLRYVYTVLRRL